MASVCQQAVPASALGRATWQRPPVEKPLGVSRFKGLPLSPIRGASGAYWKPMSRPCSSQANSRSALPATAGRNATSERGLRLRCAKPWTPSRSASVVRV